MELSLQFGYGMMQHTRTLLSEWGGGAVVLSPRDLTEAQIERLGADVAARNGRCLVDPQCFIRGSDHERLTQHAHWRVYASHTTGAFMGGPGTSDLLEAVRGLNDRARTDSVILPGLFADEVSDDWFALQENIIVEGQHHFDGKPLLATVALSSSVLAVEDYVEEIIERSLAWDVSGYYVVPETPSSYLVEDPVWMSNLLSLLAGLKLQGREVVLGYASHQFLAAAAANTDLLCTGTWLNVRSFAPDKFMRPDEDTVRRKTTWYYCPQALSEYKIPFLDIARRSGVLGGMAPPVGYPSNYSAPLFTGAQPTSVRWGEQDAFRHYLTSVRHQANQATASGFDEALDFQMRALDEAHSVTELLRASGVFGQNREFTNAIDATRSALIQLRRSRGPLLRRHW